MASMFTNCLSSTASRLIHPNHPNGAFLPRRCLGQLCLRTGRGPIRSSSSDAAMVLDENPVAEKIMLDMRLEASRMKRSVGAEPGLAVILIGDSKLSEGYHVPCGFVGIKTFLVRLAQDSPEEEVLKSVSRFNDDPFVHGILVHSPLPSHMDADNIVNAISVEKDIDGFHPLNIGRLAMRGREPLFVPGVPKGYVELLRGYNLEIKGKRAVVIGRSNHFGMPIALLLQREDATVTIIHSETKNPEEITRQADIVISAVGKPNMVRGSWIKPGAVVINVGTSCVNDPKARYGYRMVGDICYEEVCKVASAITSIDNGVGMMTLAMLLSNTLASAKRFHNFM